MLGPADGMPRGCAANLDHIQTVAKSRIGGPITTLDRSRLSEVRSALLFALGF
jgi:mRNA interferase MazF